MADRLLNHRLARFISRHPLWTLSAIGLTATGSCVLILVFLWMMVDQGGIRFQGHDYIQYVNDTSETLTLTVCMNSCIGEDPTFELPPGQKFLTSERGPRPAFWTRITREDGSTFGCLHFEDPLGKTYRIDLSSAIPCPEFHKIASPVSD